eukprot:COSAG04_NODE_1662_length_6018_cov_1.781889_4_plen_90_part_00
MRAGTHIDVPLLGVRLELRYAPQTCALIVCGAVGAFFMLGERGWQMERTVLTTAGRMSRRVAVGRRGEEGAAGGGVASGAARRLVRTQA